MRKIIFLTLIVSGMAEAAFAQSGLSANKQGKPTHLYKKVLVLSLNRIYDFRKTVEDEITWWLKEKGFNAHSCNKLLPASGLPSNEMINDLVQHNDFDAVLISDVMDVKDKERFENTQQRYTYNPNTPKIFYFFDTYNNAYNQGYTYNTKTYLVNTRLFDVRSEEVVYETTSSTYESENLDKAIEDFAKSLASGLKKKKLLEKTVIH